jgi:DNA-binding transcriptional LysR family regulator
MNLNAVRTFLAIVETGSLVRASERLNVTQSTVTARLKGLEAELGQTLLHRQKSGVSLTANGFRFRRYAEAMVGLWKQAHKETSLPEGAGAVCNLACHIDLWPLAGRGMIEDIRKAYPATVISAWPGDVTQLEQWLETGLIDAALTYRRTAQRQQTIHELGTERLMLFSTRSGSPARFDPGYVYVDLGGDFGRQHSINYADADVAKLTFGCAVWALDHILDHGGSAYLPEHLTAPLLAKGKLHLVADAPVYERQRFLITNDMAAEDWPWLADLVSRYAARPSPILDWDTPQHDRQPSTRKHANSTKRVD